MSGNVREFGNIARSLSGSPLGVIALFLVFVYGLASLVIISANWAGSIDTALIVYFLILFPVIVLGVFGWLVSCHHDKLIWPQHFKDENNFLRMKEMLKQTTMTATSLALAESKNFPNDRELDVNDMRSISERAVTAIAAANQTEKPEWCKTILWVDNKPEGNIHERRAFEGLGLKFVLSSNTTDALDRLSDGKFGAIISNMARPEGHRAGYTLLDTIRAKGNRTPLFFYTSSNAPGHKRETAEHGGQGCTNNARELFEMVANAVL